MAGISALNFLQISQCWIQGSLVQILARYLESSASLFPPTQSIQQCHNVIQSFKIIIILLTLFGIKYIKFGYFLFWCLTSISIRFPLCDTYYSADFSMKCFLLSDFNFFLTFVKQITCYSHLKDHLSGNKQNIV